VQLARLQEIFSRFKGSRSKAERLDEKCGGPADGLIVVNYRDQTPFHLHSPLTPKLFPGGKGINWMLGYLVSQKGVCE
jgi:hypothetical protein